VQIDHVGTREGAVVDIAARLRAIEDRAVIRESELVGYMKLYEHERRRIDAIRKAIEQWEKATGQQTNSDIVSLSQRILVNAGLKQHDECEVYT
jgi:hypothetical protein